MGKWALWWSSVHEQTRRTGRLDVHVHLSKFAARTGKLLWAFIRAIFPPFAAYKACILKATYLCIEINKKCPDKLSTLKRIFPRRSFYPFRYVHKNVRIHGINEFCAKRKEKQVEPINL